MNRLIAALAAELACLLYGHQLWWTTAGTNAHGINSDARWCSRCREWVKALGEKEAG